MNVEKNWPYLAHENAYRCLIFHGWLLAKKVFLTSTKSG